MSANVLQEKSCLPLLRPLACLSGWASCVADLTHIGGLPTLLGLLQSRYAPVRASAAEVVATCVQNNPPVQQYFLENGALPKLLKLTEDADPTVRYILCIRPCWTSGKR